MGFKLSSKYLINCVQILVRYTKRLHKYDINIFLVTYFKSLLCFPDEKTSIILGEAEQNQKQANYINI